MRVKEFEREIAALTPFGATALDQRTRSLREANMLPVGAPGPNAPHLDIRHAASILVSLAAETARDAARTVMTYECLVRQGRGGGQKLFMEALWNILEDPDNRQDIAEVRINCSWPEALIVKKSGKRIVYLPRKDTAEKFCASVDLVLRASALTMLARALKDSEAERAKAAKPSRKPGRPGAPEARLSV